MNVFCCQQICHVPNSEQLYQPRTSNYKLNNYTSQSTTSSQIKRAMPPTCNPIAKKLSWSPAKTIKTPVYHPTNLSPEKKLYEAVIVNHNQKIPQRSPQMNRTLMSKPETPIHGLTGMASESNFSSVNTQHKMLLRKHTGG